MASPDGFSQVFANNVNLIRRVGLTSKRINHTVLRDAFKDLLNVLPITQE